MKNKANIFSRVRVLYLLLIISCLFLNMGLKRAFCEEVNPFKELIKWTKDQSIGITLLYNNLDERWDSGFNWRFVKSEHDWLYSGIMTTGFNNENLIEYLGTYVSFNLGKIIEKAKPFVYLKHLEVGYYYCWNIYGNTKSRKGIFVNVIKKEF